MQPDPATLFEILGLKTPSVGFYDAPDAAPFEPLVRPEPGRWSCMFAFYADWLRLSYTYVFRSPEFVSQRGGDEFGALTLSVVLPF